MYEYFLEFLNDCIRPSNLRNQNQLLFSMGRSHRTWSIGISGNISVGGGLDAMWDNISPHQTAIIERDRETESILDRFTTTWSRLGSRAPKKCRILYINFGS
jgi:hypothetical protein